jgi:hypothetical protein
MTLQRPPWPVRLGDGPEQRLSRLKLGFRGVTRRWDRAVRRRELYRVVMLWVIGAVLGFAVAWEFLSSPWPPIATLKHYMAFPNCAATRMVGLAPAYKGQPGYWSRNDRDKDGIACEPWPNQRKNTTPAIVKRIRPRVETWPEAYCVLINCSICARSSGVSS